MDYRILGRTGVKVSPLCFGTMSFGDIADEAESARMFQRCRELGINFFDCANTYAGGRSEEILGNLIADCRDDIVLTTKAVSRTGDDINAGGASRRHIQIAVEDSLRRLKTDRIDVYFLHHYDAETPVDEMLRALDDLVRQGKILYPAVSNWAAWQVMKAQGIAARQGLARIECLQPMYNLVKRQAEVEILPMAAQESIGVIPYSPLGGGLLTGKYTPQHSPDEGRLVVNAMYKKRYGVDDYYRAAGRLCRVRPRARLGAGNFGCRLGDGASSRDRANHRRAQSDAAGRLAGGAGCRFDAGLVRRDFQPVADPAARP